MRGCICGESNNNNSNVLSANNNVSINTCCNKEEGLLDNLCRFLGNRCVCEFATANFREPEIVSGVLERVGCDFLTIRTNNNRSVICNSDNLIFVTIL